MYNTDFLVLLGKEKQQMLLRESEVRGLLKFLRAPAQTAARKSQIKPVQEENPCPT